MPACFDNWCSRFDDIFSRQKQRQAFRIYLGGLLGESERKNLSQLARNTVDGSYNSLRHFLNESAWDVEKLNQRRWQVMQSCRQTTPSRGFTLIVDDSGHRKSTNATDGVGRQYIGEIGKTDNGIVLLTTHLYDGVRRLPLDVALYQHASSLAGGKQDPNLIKKPDLALQLIDACLERGSKPGVTLVDAGYGNNTPFIKQLESRKLTYIAAIAKNRQVTCQVSGDERPRKHGFFGSRSKFSPKACPETPGAFLGGLRVMAVDGTVLDVPDSQANARVFGYPSSCQKATLQVLIQKANTHRSKMQTHAAGFFHY